MFVPLEKFDAQAVAQMAKAERAAKATQAAQAATNATNATKVNGISGVARQAAPLSKHQKALQAANQASQTATGGGGGLKAFFANPKKALGTAWDNVAAGKGAIPKMAKYANALQGIYAANQLFGGISDYSNAVSDTDQLISDILASAGSNPNLRHDLSADQLQLLRKLQNGTYDSSAGFSVDGVLNNLLNTAIQAGTGYLSGGTVGAILGGAGGIAEGITSGMVSDQGQITSELEGLYNALYESEMRDKSMRRDAAMQRYADSIYGY